MDKSQRRARRKKTIRKKVFGSAERPRLCVHKSNKKIYAQIVDDFEQKTICSASTSGAKGSSPGATMKNKDMATALGKRIAEAAVEKGIKKVVFDRGGYKYHGRIKALADGAREAGLKF